MTTRLSHEHEFDGHWASSGDPLADCTVLEYILLGDLQDLLDEPDDEVNRRWIAAILESLLDTLPQQERLRDEGGYLSEVLAAFPSWYPRVDELHEERRRLFRSLRALNSALDRCERLHAVVDPVRTGLRNWISRVTNHRREERLVIQEAFTLDVGAGD
jgi:hypothetical protein